MIFYPYGDFQSHLPVMDKVSIIGLSTTGPFYCYDQFILYCYRHGSGENYTPLRMGHAIEAVRKDQSVAFAAKKYGVPRITLRNKITGKNPSIYATGPPSVLRKAEESILGQGLFAMSERHCPISKEQLLDSVQLFGWRSNSFY